MHPLLQPDRLFSRAEVLARPGPVPEVSGVYGWYFRSLPGVVPVGETHEHVGCRLLYIGISPKRPPANGRKPSAQNLRKRIRNHFRGNAEFSTLRLTLGSLLASEIGIQLSRTSSGKSRTFGTKGEDVLSAWMADNAFVCWHTHPEPWVEEGSLIANLDLPLNLSGNSQHPFARTLSEIRAIARRGADLSHGSVLP